MLLTQISESMIFIESMNTGIEIEERLLASRKMERDALPVDVIPELSAISMSLIEESEKRVRMLRSLQEQAMLFKGAKMLMVCKQALERYENGETNIFNNIMKGC
jgi:hypothetical protein